MVSLRIRLYFQRLSLNAGRDAQILREEVCSDMKELSEGFEKTRATFSGEIEGLKSELHQMNLELPRKMGLIDAAVEIHSDEVSS